MSSYTENEIGPRPEAKPTPKPKNSIAIELFAWSGAAALFYILFKLIF